MARQIRGYEAQHALHRHARMTACHERSAHSMYLPIETVDQLRAISSTDHQLCGSEQWVCNAHFSLNVLCVDHKYAVWSDREMIDVSIPAGHAPIM